MDSIKEWQRKHPNGVALPEGLHEALVKVENAAGEEYPINKTSGAVGQVQMLPATAYEWGAKDLSNTELSKASKKYLGYLIEKFGDVDKAVRAYNAGPSRIANEGKPDQRPPTKESKDYAPKLHAAWDKLTKGNDWSDARPLEISVLKPPDPTVKIDPLDAWRAKYPVRGAAGPVLPAPSAPAPPAPPATPLALRPTPMYNATNQEQPTK